MNIDSFTLDDLYSIAEGMYCFGVSGTPSESRMQGLVLALQEYHESSDEEILDGLAYYERGEGMKPNLEYDYDRRQEYFENELGYE